MAKVSTDLLLAMQAVIENVRAYQARRPDCISLGTVEALTRLDLIAAEGCTAKEVAKYRAALEVAVSALRLGLQYVLIEKQGAGGPYEARAIQNDVDRITAALNLANSTLSPEK